MFGHTGATSTALSPGSISVCMSRAMAFIADAVTVTRSAAKARPCSRLM